MHSDPKTAIRFKWWNLKEFCIYWHETLQYYLYCTKSELCQFSVHLIGPSWRYLIKHFLDFMQDRSALFGAESRSNLVKYIFCTYIKQMKKSKDHGRSVESRIVENILLKSTVVVVILTGICFGPKGWRLLQTIWEVNSMKECSYEPSFKERKHAVDWVQQPYLKSLRFTTKRRKYMSTKMFLLERVYKL